MSKKEKKVDKQIELEEKCNEYLTGWKRALADYDNLKKDMSRERDEMRRHTTETLALGLLTVLDHFDQAIKHRPDLDGCDNETQKKVNGWISGVEHVRTALGDELKNFGLEPIEPQTGDTLDSNEHEAVSTRSEEDSEPGMIVEVTARGWKLKDKIIQPAKVIISE